jgi:glycosyltransferase involved in cell wall biosynthesis
VRVALLGNLCNTAYTFAKALRAHGVGAEVFVTEREARQIAGSPEWEDPEIDSRHTPWIHYYDQRRPRSLLATTRALRAYDIVHAFGLPNTYCQFLGRTRIAHALGADLKEVAYERSLRGVLMRRSFRTADAVFYSDIDHVPDVERQGLPGARYFPAAVDIEKYHPDRPVARYPDPDGATVFLHASLLDWTRGQRTGKRNDLFFRAFARWAGGRSDVWLRVIAAGPDAVATRGLVSELGLASVVEFLPPLNKQELLRHYLSCDAIVDQFGMPKLGVNALEGMACGRVVLLTLQPTLTRRCYPEEPPAWTADSVEGILACLRQVAGREQLRSLGAACREWILRYHGGAQVASRLAEEYRAVLQGRLQHPPN